MSRSNPLKVKALCPPAPPQPFRVLLVDGEPEVLKLLTQAIAGEGIVLVEADSIEEARQKLALAPVDLALIEPNLPDGSGMALADEIKRQRPITQTIVITGEPSLERAVEAIRIGAADFIAKPVDMYELNFRVKQALGRHQADRDKVRRVRRLRRVCKKLNQAHDEVTQQVDILCNDLVAAYQVLASQIQQVAQTREFSLMLRHELDLEQVLRRTLEYVLQKAGPTNAAIFLPATADEYTLGGYVNYDCSKESADMLLQHLANVVAPRFGQCPEPVHLSDNATLAQWIGDDWNYLADSQLVAASCRHNGENLAVLVLFRDQSEPYDAPLVAHLGCIAPLLGSYLAKVIRIHHRSLGGYDGETVG